MVWTLPVLLVLIPVKPSNCVSAAGDKDFVKIDITPCVQSRLLEKGETPSQDVSDLLIQATEKP